MYINFGDMCRSRLNISCQYGSRYITGHIEGYPVLGANLRIKGDERNYHSYMIHKDDIQTFVDRYFNYLRDR